jgi:ubiquinone/menaquinone biosynthesis C-methylase UbiE
VGKALKERDCRRGAAEQGKKSICNKKKTLGGEMMSDHREKSVAEHYHVDALAQRILEVLEKTGKPADAVTAADLAPVDEFHIGGREATEEIAARMRLRPGMHLLDVGCGIGGPARYFASAHGCRVTGIDVTEAFLETAKSLTEKLGLSGRVSFRQASALKMPFGDGEFDAAYEFHVGMNLADKRGVFAEVGRVLKAKGIFAVYDVIRTGPGEIKFPVPWASRAEDSFVATREEYLEAFRAAGFEVIEERVRRELAIDFVERMKKRAEEKDARALTVQLVMGETAPQKLANTVESVLKGIFAPAEMIAQKRG